ncbi:MAG: hypothetical protein ACOYBY_13035 [Dermatophilaceae bacterium]
MPVPVAEGLDSLLVIAAVGPLLSRRSRLAFVVLLGFFDALGSFTGWLVSAAGSQGTEALSPMPGQSPLTPSDSHSWVLMLPYLVCVAVLVVTRRRAIVGVPLALTAALLSLDNYWTGCPDATSVGSALLSASTAAAWSVVCGLLGLAAGVGLATVISKSVPFGVRSRRQVSEPILVLVLVTLGVCFSLA